MQRRQISPNSRPGGRYNGHAWEAGEVKFIYRASHRTIRGRHIYRRSEYSFDFTPVPPEGLRRLIGPSGTASVSANEVQLEMDLDTGRLLYAWGLCPHMGWQDTDASPIGRLVDGQVFALKSKPILGASYPISPSRERWRVMANRALGWVILTSPTNTGPEVLVRIADGCILGLKGTELVSLWIHPEMRD